MNPCNIFDNANLNKIQQEDGVTDLQGKAMIELGFDENRERRPNNDPRVVPLHLEQ